jgi:hypothetical protein
LCLFAATVFWFFNALNKSYSANISFPLAFDYNQEGYIPVTKLPEHIRMNVSGIGWDLFRKSSGLKVPPLVIPLDRPSDVKKIVGSTLPALFSNQLSGVQINFVLMDTVFVDIDERVRKRVRIKIDSINKYIHPDYGIVNEVTIEPDTVWVEGPKRAISALKSELIISLPKRNIDNNFNEEIAFQSNKLIKREPPTIEVSFDVEKLIEVSDRIQLVVMNAPKRLKSSIDVTEISCTYRLPVSLVNTLSGDSLHAVIDLNKYSPGKQTISPHVIGLPKYAHLIKVDSVRVNF